MSKPVVCVRDVKADQFGNPFFPSSKGVALREFQDVVNQPNEDSIIYKHPEDFDLYLLGEFDESTGKFDVLDLPELMMAGKAAKLGD